MAKTSAARQKQALLDVCTVLDDPSASDEGIGWAVFRTDGRGLPLWALDRLAAGLTDSEREQEDERQHHEGGPTSTPLWPTSCGARATTTRRSTIAWPPRAAPTAWPPTPRR